jgi:serine/threonine-protein kinase HipA
MVKNPTSLDVFYHSRLVGNLLMNREGKIGFSYAESWLKNGFSISPFSLPLKAGIFLPKNGSSASLFGVFNDSLPDSWGSFVTNQWLLKRGINPGELNSLARLALLDERALGALRYHEKEEVLLDDRVSFDEVREECLVLIEKRNCDALDQLAALGGSSGGAHPKIHYRKNGLDYLVKFPGPQDPLSFGRDEYIYNQAASKCGINVATSFLFKSERCPGYFASLRFDRANGERIHMISLASLYEVSVGEGLLDYGHLFSATWKLTKDKTALEEVYRRMVFNVLAKNNDDHAKNFAFLYDEKKQSYFLSPAYDLTPSGSLLMHGMSIHHNLYPTLEDCHALAASFGFSAESMDRTDQQVSSVALSELKTYLH